MAAGDSVRAFYAAREFLFAHRDDYDTAYRDFRWPELDTFNWALDYFDAVAADPVRGAQRALWIVEQDGSEAYWTFAELAARSNRVANWLRERGVRRGDRIVLDARQPGRAVGDDAGRDEARRGRHPGDHRCWPRPTCATGSTAAGARHVVVAASATPGKFDDVPGDYTRIAVGGAPQGWLDYGAADAAPADFTPDGATRADDPLLLYFTSGTTARPKLVEHTHASYPVGHLSTMYWIGLQPGDVHLNISSPGWAKHAWSNVFAPWNAEATVLVIQLRAVRRRGRCSTCSTAAGSPRFCAPPTVWRMLIQADLTGLQRPPARGRRRRRAAQPRGHRAGRAGLGRHDPRRLRPDRDHRADRQHAGPAGQARLDGPAAARLHGRAARPGHRARPRTRARSASTSRPGRSA